MGLDGPDPDAPLNRRIIDRIRSRLEPLDLEPSDEYVESARWFAGLRCSDDRWLTLRPVSSAIDSCGWGETGVFMP